MNQLIDRLREQFESAWCSDSPLSIEAAIKDIDADLQESSCVELLKLEIALRQSAGQQPTIDEYIERFPQHREVIRPLFTDSQPMEETVDLKPQQVEATTSFSLDTQSKQTTAADDRVETRQTIGRYTVIAKLGRGGQADVYRAIHPTLPIEVAIKLSHAALVESARQALSEEAHILCELDHPHIARIRDFDFDDDRPYMVLDFVRGRSLGQVVALKPLDAQSAADVVVKVARAIGYAHARGVIHRDLKPDNIVMDTDGQPKIIDFGMSRLRSGYSSEQVEADEVSGTFAYMAPEQAEGIQSKTDHRVDIFALGGILYRLLVGRPPYASGSLNSLLSSVREGAWDEAALKEANIPDELKRICRRALSPDPVMRYPTAETMADELTAFIDQQKSVASNAVTAKPSSATTKAKGIAALALIAVPVLATALYLVDPWGVPMQPSGADETVVAAAPATDQINMGKLIQNLSITHIGNEGARAKFIGPLFQNRQPRENDDLQVHAEFAEPVYCFLVALNPDGVKQLCYPSDPAIAQTTPLRTLQYPADTDSAFGLTDGPGQQAFVLYASKTPLPAFDDWESKLTASDWPVSSIVGNWEYREGQLEIREPSPRSGSTVRGNERKTKTATPFRDLCDSLKQAGGSDVSGVTFEVDAS